MERFAALLSTLDVVKRPSRWLQRSENFRFDCEGLKVRAFYTWAALSPRTATAGLVTTLTLAAHARR